MDGDSAGKYKWFTWLFILAEVIGVILVIMMAIWTGYYLGGYSWQADPAKEFNWHPMLLTLSLIFLYGNGM